MKLKFGLVGVGYWNHHFRLLTEHPEVELKMVCDKNYDAVSKLKVPKGHKPIWCTADLNDLLENPINYEIDCVVVSTPVTTHFEIVKKLLEAGKHVLCEKAFTTTVSDCEELIAIAKYKKLKLAVGQTYLYNVGVQDIKKILDKNILGDVYYVSMTRVGMSPQRMDCNAIWDLGAHDISMLIYWFGMPVNVSSFGRSYLNDGVEDFAVSSFEFPNKVIASVKNSWLNPVKRRSITIVGSKMMLTFDDIDKVIEMYSKEGKLESTVQVPSEPLSDQLDDFIQSVLENKKPLVTGEVGLQIVKVLEATDKSLKNNNEKITL